MANNLKQLSRKRGSKKAALTTFDKYLTSFSLEQADSQAYTELELKLNKLSKDFEEFNLIQIEMEMLCEESELDAQYKEGSETSENYFHTISKAKCLLKQLKVKIEPSTELPSSFSSTPTIAYDPLQNIAIPKMKIPQFNGEFEKWTEFKAVFNSIINSNVSITSMHKFQILRTSVEGYAKRIIDNIEFTNSDSHFEKAWQALCDRFDKKHILINKHIKAIFDLDAIPKESSKQYRTFLDSISDHISAMESLNICKTSLCDVIIIHVLSNKLDRHTYRSWKEMSSDIPTLNEFLEFLKSKVDLLEELRSDHPMKDVKDNHKEISTYNHRMKSSRVNINYVAKCNYCKGNHLIYSCTEFLKLDIPTRKAKITNLKLCINCLRTGHLPEQCHSGNCRKCHLKHNSLLHSDDQIRSSHNISQTQLKSKAQRDEISNFNTSNNHDIQSGDRSSTNLSTNLKIPNNYVLLSTVLVDIQGRDGKAHLCRAILDSGAQSNLITSEFCEKLELPLKETNLELIGINQNSSKITKYSELVIHSRVNSYKTKATFFVVPTITGNIPEQNLKVCSLKLPNVELSDPQFYIPNSVDAIIGANLFWQLLLYNKIMLGKGKPTLYNTKLGWIVAGSVPIINSSKAVCNFSQNSRCCKIDDQLRQFWEIEECSKPVSNLSNDDIQCEKLFNETVMRNEEGRFVVRIPFKYSPIQLGESKQNAINSMQSLEKRFVSNKSFKDLYIKFIDDYASSSHMRLVEGEQDQFRYFLPHHGVMRNESLTTKLRVVFNGSSPTTTGWSLNDLQFTGPNYLNDLFDILLRFRKYNYVVIADIKQMYRQILVNPQDRYLQSIIWRDDPDKPFSSYELNTVTYGTKSAPYLAIKCLHYLAEENKDVSPHASQTIISDFYMDDLITGDNDQDQLISNCNTISEILSSACFPLHKWASNNKEILSQLCTSNDIDGNIYFEKAKTLGIMWLTNEDQLAYHFKTILIPRKITKRHILSEIARIYDPLGLLSACTILAKILIQDLWKARLNWDDTIPEQLSRFWIQFVKELSHVDEVKIPRRVIIENPKTIQLLGFCDASQKAYAAVIYLRSVDDDDNINVRLLCAKTKVAPVKTVTIPRLELLGALLLTRLVSKVKKALKVNVNLEIYLWCDSQVVLHWIHTKPSSLQQYVAHRVSEIQSLSSKVEWNYVSSKQNPADYASRGVMPSALKTTEVWWNGPEWLTKTPFQFSKFKVDRALEIPELKKQTNVYVNINTENEFSIFTKFSSFIKLKRTFAYVIRFISNSKTSKDNRHFGPLSKAELSNSLKTLIRMAQKETFAELYTALRNNQLSHKYLSLSPFLDSDDLIRVGGRLKNSNLCIDSKHPYLLHGKHPFTKLIFSYYHFKHLHPGPNLLLSIVREQFWPTAGTVTAKSTVKGCIKCLRYNPHTSTNIMADLPKERVSISYPFETCGVDYAGPLYLKDKKGRGSKIFKAYICLFVCFTTKAIHIELTTDLSSDCFIAALRRFVSRKGKPTIIYSDNGSNFVGAAKELKILSDSIRSMSNTLHDYCANENITWKFIPPQSPNFGGLWESGVKCIKRHLFTSIGEARLTYEEMLTVLIQVEATLNSRPLCPLSSDPNEYQSITPSHFILGRSPLSVPDPDVCNVPVNRLSRYQLLQRLHQSFWQRWSREYLHHLQQRTKWFKRMNNIEVGTLVLIKQDHTSHPRCWPLGRVTQVHPGSDNVVRVVSVKTPHGVFKRCVSKICPLLSPSEP